MSDLRQTLHSAFTFVRSIETNKATASLTMDHLVQEQINSLKKGETRSISDARGENLGNRLSRWDQLDALEKRIAQAVQAIKAAGNDPDKLASLGIDEAGKTVVEDQ